MESLLKILYEINSFDSRKRYKRVVDKFVPVNQDLMFYSVFKKYSDQIIDKSIYKDDIIDLEIRSHNFKEVKDIPSTGILIHSIYNNKLYHKTGSETIDLFNYKNWLNHINKLVNLIESQTKIQDYLFGVEKEKLEKIHHQFVINWLMKNKIAIKAVEHPIINSMYTTCTVIDRSGNKYPLKTKMIKQYGELLYNIIIKKQFTKSLEIGLKYGNAALFFCIAHLNSNKDKNYHIAIDPNQMTKWHGIGVENIKKIGYKNLKFIDQPSYLALPALLKKFVGNNQWSNSKFDPEYERIDICFINGWHVFDNVLLDMFYCDLLLKVYGYIVLDDAELPALNDIAKYIDSNWNHYERVNTTFKRFTIYRKLKDDERSWNYHIKFTC